MAGPKDLADVATRPGRGSGTDAVSGINVQPRPRTASAAGHAPSAARSFGTADDGGVDRPGAAVPQDDTVRGLGTKAIISPR